MSRPRATPALLRNPGSGKVHLGTAEDRRVGCARRGDVRATYELLAIVTPSRVEWAVGWQLLAVGVRPSRLCGSCFHFGFVDRYAREWRNLGT